MEDFAAEVASPSFGAASDWQIKRGPTTLVNATGAVVIELWQPGSETAPKDSDAASSSGQRGPERTPRL